VEWVFNAMVFGSGADGAVLGQEGKRRRLSSASFSHVEEVARGYQGDGGAGRRRRRQQS
jgi:hypothetical protein